MLWRAASPAPSAGSSRSTRAPAAWSAAPATLCGTPSRSRRSPRRTGSCGVLSSARPRAPSGGGCWRPATTVPLPGPDHVSLRRRPRRRRRSAAAATIAAVARLRRGVARPVAPLPAQLRREVLPVALRPLGRDLEVLAELVVPGQAADAEHVLAQLVPVHVEGERVEQQLLGDVVVE